MHLVACGLGDLLEGEVELITDKGEPGKDDEKDDEGNELPIICVLVEARLRIRGNRRPRTSRLTLVGEGVLERKIFPKP